MKILWKEVKRQNEPVTELTDEQLLEGIKICRNYKLTAALAEYEAELKRRQGL